MSYRIEAWERDRDHYHNEPPHTNRTAQYLPDVARVLAELMPTHDVVVVTKLEDDADV